MKTPATATAIDSTDRSVQERTKTAVPRAEKNFVNKRQNIGERMLCTHVTVGQIDRYSHTYLRRQQERGLTQKARRLMDENSVSFQMFLILLYSITLGSESQISVFKQCLSNI